MTDTSPRKSAAGDMRYHDEPTAWAGWVVFGGVMLIMMGLFQVIEGLLGLFDLWFCLVPSSGLVVDVNYTPWGWSHLIIGVFGVLAGLGLLVGNMAARIVGIAAA